MIHVALEARRRGVLLSLACLVLLGVLPIVSARRPLAHDALAFAVVMSVWQLAFSIPLVLYERRKGPHGAAARTGFRSKVLLLGTGIMFGLATYLYIAAVDRAGPVSFAIAVQAYPLFAMLWEVLFLGRTKRGRELAFTGSLLVAMYYLGTGGTWRIDGLSTGFALALAVPLLWSVAHVILKELLGQTRISPNQVVFTRVLVSTLFLGGMLLVLSGPGPLRTALLDPELQAVALLMGGVYYLELLLWFHTVRSIDVSLASSITVPAPALTLLLGVMFLGQAVAGYQVVALLGVLVSMFGLVASARRHE